jgi:propanol-preferring alcohol dehydrogenase
VHEEKNMKAVVVKEGKAPLVVEERPKPKPKPGEVLIKVKACGVCHSDLMVAQGLIPYAAYPIVLGHEVAGVIDELGEGATWLKKGDRVGMPWLFSSCGHCDQCVAGKDILCPYQKITGVNQDGGYQEYMIAPALYVAPIPDGLDFVEAGPIMCAGLTVFNRLRSEPEDRGDRTRWPRSPRH